jgi:outer membrane immunogenic protein
MRKLLVTALALGALVMPAAAADLAPYYKVAPAWSWTGFYLGGDVGGAFSSDNATWNPTGPLANVLLSSPVTGSTGGSAFAGGLFAGYNWQFSPSFVAGIEGDWTGMRAGGSVNSQWNGVLALPGFTSASVSSELEWAASLRGRLGYLIWPNLLAYGTAGGAWGKVQYGGNAFNQLFAYQAGAGFTNTTSGWVAGGGLEWVPFTGFGLTLRLEYLYYDFSSGQNFVSPAVGLPLNPSSFTWGSTTVSVARFGMSYKF